MPLASAVTCTGPRWWTTKPVVAVERRVQVGDDPHLPVAAVVDGLERRQGGVLVAGAERARAPGIGLDLGGPGREVARSLCPLGHDRDPPPGEWVETQLTHSAVQDTHAGADRARTEPAGSACHLRQRVHRDVLRAVVLERVRSKSSQRSASAKPGGGRHRVELGRRGVADRPTAAAAPARRRRTRRTGRRPAASSGSCSEIDSTTSSARHRAHGDDRARRGGSSGTNASTTNAPPGASRAATAAKHARWRAADSRLNSVL